jgi:hypothetical protein
MSKIRKPAIPSIFMAMACAAALFFTSCKDKTAVLIPVPKDSSALGKIHHLIGRDSINLLRNAFNSERKRLGATIPDLFITESEGFNKPALLEVLKNPDCVGVRIYYGVMNDSTNGGKRALKMIIVGTDSNGKDLYISRGSAAATRLTSDDAGLEYGQCCHGEAAQ